MEQSARDRQQEREPIHAEVNRAQLFYPTARGLGDVIGSEWLGGGQSRAGESQVVKEQHRLREEQAQTGQKQIQHRARKKPSTDERSVGLEWGLNTPKGVWARHRMASGRILCSFGRGSGRELGAIISMWHGAWTRCLD